MIIDQLPLLGGDVQGTDEFPIERGTTTYKTTQAALVKTATDAAAAAQLAADNAQLAADNAQDTADEANEKGLPPGGTAGQVLTKSGSTDYSASWQNPSGGDVTADMLGIVIDGNSTAIGASAGQYVIVKNSTITGITDGLYTAALAIPANTAIDATYLTAVSGGGLNALNDSLQHFPDYSNVIVYETHMTANTEYSMPADGFVILYGYGGESRYMNFYINNNKVLGTYSILEGQKYAQMYPVRKNDILKVTATGSAWGPVYTLFGVRSI